jgi:hypothetical protein
MTNVDIWNRGEQNMADHQGSRKSRLEERYVHILSEMAQEARALAGNANHIADHIEQTLQQGGIINIQPQLRFLVGALLRLQKDMGVTEFLQSENVRASKPQKPR